MAQLQCHCQSQDLNLCQQPVVQPVLYTKLSQPVVQWPPLAPLYFILYTLYSALAARRAVATSRTSEALALNAPSRSTMCEGPAAAGSSSPVRLEASRAESSLNAEVGTRVRRGKRRRQAAMAAAAAGWSALLSATAVGLEAHTS